MADIIKPKRTTYSVAINSTKVLEKDEMLVVTPDTGSGTGKYMFIFGDGVTQVKNLPMSIDGKYADELIINSLETLSESSPALTAGDSIKRLLSKIKKNIETLIATKINTTAIYADLDSSNGSQVLAATAGKQLKQLYDNNTSAISTLNSDIAAKRCIVNSTPSNYSLALTATLKYLSTAWTGTATCPYLTANSLGVTVDKAGYYLIHLRLSLTTDVGSATIMRFYRGIRHILSGTNDDKVDALYINGSAQTNDYTSVKYCNAGEILRPVAYTSDASVGTITITGAALQVAFLSS